MSTLCNLSAKLKMSGNKLTPARQAIITVLENTTEHLSHEQILQAGQAIYPPLSRATVYRTIELLVELGLLRPVYLHDPAQRFVSASGGHHHLVCTRCGHTIEFEHCYIDNLATNLAEQYHFQVNSHLLELHGLCEACRL